jgi:hypothetical protein
VLADCHGFVRAIAASVYPVHALGAFLVGGLVLSVFVTDNALLKATARTIQAPCFPWIARKNPVLTTCRRAPPLRRVPANVTILSQRKIRPR